MDKRIKWAARDCDLLKRAYAEAKTVRIKYPNELLNKFTKKACNTKAEKLGFKIRCKWSDKDVSLLKNAYANSNTRGGVGGGINYSEDLLKRHSKVSCHQKASKLKLTKWFVEQRIHIENWPDFDIGYFAGIVDGEGCINWDEKRHVYRLHVANTDTNLMEWLKERIGMGSYYQEVRHEKKPHWKDAYVFVISSVTDLLGILKAIEPHLIIKRDKAREAIKLLEKKIEWRKQRAPNRR